MSSGGTTISARHRTATVLLSAAFLGAVIAPSAVAQTAPQMVAQGLPVEAGEVPPLDRDQVLAMRERVARIVAQEPELLAALGAEGPRAAAVGPDVRRLSGPNRFATAAAIAQAYWVEHFWNEKYGPLPGPKLVFIASGHDFPDALSGGAVAAAAGGPLLLTQKDELSKPTREVLTRLRPDVIVVLGGTGAVSTAVERQLRSYVDFTGNVRRVGGSDRFEVSAALAEMIGWSTTAFVASGANFPDGLSGGAAAGHAIAPLLITRQSSVPQPVLDVLKNEVIPERIYVVGGPTVVSDEVVRQLRRIAPVERVDGSNRFVVAQEVARLHPSAHIATVADGRNWPDALAGSALAGLVGSKLLLSRDPLPQATKDAVVEHSLVTVDVLGGPGAVPDSVLQELRRLPVNPPR